MIQFRDLADRQSNNHVDESMQPNADIRGTGSICQLSMMNYFAELKKALVQRAFVTAREAVLKKPVRNLGCFVVEFLLILFLSDLDRNLPSSKLPRHWDPDFKNAMFTAGRNLVPGN
jgi:hypothetical protein